MTEKIFDLKALRAELNEQSWEPDYQDNPETSEVRRVFLGTVFALTPSGKFYTPWACSNVTEAEADEDEQWYDKARQELESIELSLEGGEDDPCDLFAVEYRDVMSPEEIKDKYAARIAALLDAVIADIREEDESLVISEIYDMHCDDFRWTFNVHRAGDIDAAEDEPQGADVTFVICESEEYDGEQNGVNFAVEIVGVGGEIVGGITPYNYTDRCWVSRGDADAVEERFQLVERAPTSDAALLVVEFVKGQQD